MVASVVIISGGMDSTVLLAAAVNEWGPQQVSALSFDYGQRHRRELGFAQWQARHYEVPWHLVDLRSVNELIDTSALTDPGIEVPEGHYEDETMKITVVPNRNSMMLNIAIAHAVAEKAVDVRIGIHAGDHAVYPDCRPDFIAKLQSLAHIACEGFINPAFAVLAPFVMMTKADIAQLGDELKVDWTQTWSCYKGGDIHCGRCSTCLERIEAFGIAGVSDPTNYADVSLYEELVKEGKLQ
jgi:7-cyano-7-deazaguanine synthase